MMIPLVKIKNEQISRIFWTYSNSSLLLAYKCVSFEICNVNMDLILKNTHVVHYSIIFVDNVEHPECGDREHKRK